MEPISSQNTRNIHRGAEIVWSIVGIIEIFLIFRFFLKLLGANANAVFTQFIYQITNAFAYPFLNVFHSEVVDGKVFEWSTLFAMFIYWLIGLGVIKLLFLGKRISSSHTTITTETIEKKVE